MLGILNETPCPLRFLRAVRLALSPLATVFQTAQWIAAAVAEKVGSVETAAMFLQRKAGEASPIDLLRFLDRAAKEVIRPGDEVDA